MTGSVITARAAGGGALLYGVPHLAYHATHLGDFDTTDAVGIVVSLTFAALAGVAALAAPGSEPAATSSPRS